MDKKYSLIVIVVAIILLAVVVSRNSSTPTSITPSPRSSTSSDASDSKECSGIPTPQQTEGPYYKTGSPERVNIAEDLPGEKLTVVGFVFDKNCKPLVNAWADFWQADSFGVYDNSGYKLRGYQFTDKDGKYTLETIVPASYENRPPHIHIKIKSEGGQILTSQLYFPDATQNQTDSIFNRALIMEITDSPSGKLGHFNFVL